MTITQLIFSVGNVIFQDFEVPEVLDALGGTQRIAEHRFPGGQITHQIYGAFPNHTSFRGILTGTSALARMREIDRVRVAGQVVPLIYGATSLLGIVTEFSPRPKHQWLIPYEMKFQPGVDLTSSSLLDDVLSLLTDINSALSALSTILSVILSPGTSGSTIATVVNFQEIYMPLPPTMAPPLTALVNDTFDALQAALGLPQNISQSSAQLIYADAAALLAVAQPLTMSGDPTQSSPALDVIGYVNTITAAVANPTLQNVTTLYVTNPNLHRISAQYYGDATKWSIIAAASGISPPDPLPIGEFVLTIPSSASIPTGG